MRAASGMALLFGLLFNLIWARPFSNWDMLGYIGIAYQFGGASPAVAHSRTYEILRQTVDTAAYRQFTERTPYHVAVARDADAFVQQLPGYRMNIIYPLLIYGMER